MQTLQDRSPIYLCDAKGTSGMLFTLIYSQQCNLNNCYIHCHVIGINFWYTIRVKW